MNNSDGIHDGRPSPGLRLAKWLASATLTVGVAFGAAYVSSLVAQAADSGPATAAAVAPCDQDGVTVGYDVRYRSSLSAYAVSGVRVVGVAPACDGSTLVVQLGATDGSLLADATLSGTVAGPSLRLPVEGAVPAASVARVYVSLEGHTTVVTPPPAIAPSEPAPTPASPPGGLTLPVAPAFCPTVSGTVTVLGLPTECGSVASSHPDTASASSIAVASWPARMFPDKVRVTLVAPDVDTLPLLAHGANGLFVKLDVVLDSSGEPIRSWDGVMAIDFPAQTGSFLSAYSQDGTLWHTIPQLDSPDLPARAPDGYYVHPDRRVTLYTRHATFFAIAPPPQAVRLVHAKLLPSGDVRLTWTPTVAGLGVDHYWILRNGRRIAVVTPHRLRTILTGLPRRSSIGVLAVDPLGYRSDVRAVPVRIPLLVGARLDGTTTTRLRAHVRLTARGSLRVLVLDRRGRKLTMLASSRVGARRAARATAELATVPLRAGSYPIGLRVALPRDGGPYRIVVLASGTGGAADRAEIRVAAR